MESSRSTDHSSFKVSESFSVFQIYVRNNWDNVFHTYTTVIFVLFLSFLLINETILAVGLIWAAHIGMDRMVGYGLKYTNTFKETHLNRV
ncbi:MULTISPECIES: DUF4260 family protein [unclassified Oceanobacillus]|uniref:DUF4260 family protein n=1 Tax=unclassified Oceanobacillus TaxID=2630292 RepID=UPI00300E0B4A